MLTSEKDVRSLERRVQTLETQQEADCQYSKRNFLRISGVEENTGKIPNVLLMNSCNTLKTELTLGEIGRCHRVGKPEVSGPRNIPVKINSYIGRQKLFKKRSDLKKSEHGLRGTFVNEHLIHKPSKLLFEARKLVNNGKVLGAWSIDGTTELVRIKSSDDLATDTTFCYTVYYTL